MSPEAERPKQCQRPTDCRYPLCLDINHSCAFPHAGSQQESALAAVTSERDALRAECDRLRAALRDILDPIGKFRRELEPGYDLDGAMAVHLAKDPQTYRDIARTALGEAVR